MKTNSFIPVQSTLALLDRHIAATEAALPESAAPTEAKFMVVYSTPRPSVPPLKTTLPLDQHSVDEGHRRGYCR